MSSPARKVDRNSSGGSRPPARLDASCDDRGPRRFVISFLMSTLLGLTALAVLNLTVDPFGAFGVTVLPADSRSGDTRTARAELLRRFTGETVLIGSSRTRVGYDGRHPSFANGPALNVGLDGTHLRELSLVVGQALANPHVRRILLSIDLHLAAQHWQPNADFHCSRFNPDRSEFEHACDLLWNGRTIEASLRALRRCIAGDASQHDELGFACGAAARFERAPQSVRSQAALSQFCGRDGLLSNLQSSAETREQMSALCDACRTAGVELTIILDPVHALLLEGLRSRGGWEDYRQWKTDIVAVAAEHGFSVWDFAGYSPETTETLLVDAAPPARWFWEPSHMRRELGDRVLERVLQSQSNAELWGERLTPQTLPQHFQQLDTAREHWLSSPGCEREVLVQFLSPHQPTAVDVRHAFAPVTRPVW